MLRVAKISLASISLLALLTVAACGSKKPPKPPPSDETDSGTSDTDMPSTSGSMGDGGASEGGSMASTDPPAAPAGIALPTAAAKAALKGKKPAAIEIKPDGTVSNNGKAIGKISGMAMQNADGSTSVLTVGSDGAVTSGDINAPYGNFSGDDLTLANGNKVSVGDDGTVTLTTGGKAAPIGKYENLGSAKKAGALAAAFVLSPPTAGKLAAPPKGPKKPKPKP